MEHKLTPEIKQSIRNTLGDALQRSVRRWPSKEALLYGARRWTFQQLAQAANRVANGLLARGLQPGDRVAAYGKNSDAYVLLWLACNRAGLIHVPINYALTEGELKYILDQSGAKAVFHDVAIAGHVEHLKPELQCALYGTFYDGGDLDVLAMAQARGNEQMPAVTIDENCVAQILYTSGTTANPKGAMMTHRALLAEYGSAIVALEISASDRSLASLPLYHSAQMHAFLMPQLLMGATTLIIAAPVPDICFDVIAREGITSFFAPPTVWISLLRHPGFDTHDLSCLRRGYYGASIMPVPVLEELRHRLPSMRVFNCYGQSEIAPLATVLSPEDHLIAPASAGRPVMNVETRVVNEQMEDMAPGEMGEIIHRSPQAMIGYWDKPDQTEEAFLGGWFHSGDVGYIDENGFLFICDRIKDVINTGGVVVSSREVEECLYTHPAVAEVAVIALPDEKWVEAVSAVVSLKVGAQVSEAELIDFAKGRIAPFKVPKSIFFKQELPRNTAGKLLKRELRREYSV
uniref:AMP-dependent synthetase and ligase n=1 Tax=Dechloromonas aromatica (strain RCB) TaxID=159087 RepID=Q47DJ4_DECAR